MYEASKSIPSQEIAKINLWFYLKSQSIVRFLALGPPLEKSFNSTFLGLDPPLEKSVNSMFLALGPPLEKSVNSTFLALGPPLEKPVNNIDISPPPPSHPLGYVSSLYS